MKKADMPLPPPGRWVRRPTAALHKNIPRMISGIDARAAIQSFDEFAFSRSKLWNEPSGIIMESETNQIQ
jgi:hypothetical protein